MAKVTLGKRPKNFNATATFQMLDGDQGEVGMVYTYRTKREFGALIDETFAPAKIEPAIVDDDGQVVMTEALSDSATEAMDRGLAANADYILKIAEGWDLGVPFDREHIEQLGDEQPAAVLAIMAKYRVAITEGRLGN